MDSLLQNSSLIVLVFKGQLDVQVFIRLQKRYKSLTSLWQEDLQAQEGVMHIAATVSNLDNFK
jgi:hypothetical protein